MTTTICNICRTPIDTTTYAVADIPNIRFGPDDAHRFLAETKRTCQFNTTDFAICQPCLVNAFKEAVAKL